MSTAIQWTDETWNPTTGCTRVSEGCRHCYIERTPAFRMATPLRHFVNGTTGVLLHPDRLDQPLHWKKPRRVFVNSLSDLFHEDVPIYFITQIFFTMALTPRHTYQVLTKRPECMRSFLTNSTVRQNLTAALAQFTSQVKGASLTIRHEDDGNPTGMILPNVWLGVSIEDQKTADERIPILLQTPAAVRFISAEPLLGPMDLTEFLYSCDGDCGQPTHPVLPTLDWIILGGESGPGARPCDLAWIRSIRDQCQTAGVPVFVKQLGAEPIEDHVIDGQEQARVWLQLKDKKGGDISEWPDDLRVREFPR